MPDTCQAQNRINATFFMVRVGKAFGVAELGRDWEEMNYVRVREALRTRRLIDRVSVKALSADTGIDKATIYRIEHTRKMPDYMPELPTLRKLADALGVDFARLMGGEMDEPTPALQELPDEVLRVARKLAQMPPHQRRPWLQLIDAQVIEANDTSDRRSATPPRDNPGAA
jgi:transcriptional regulator with XRE-family HTH domain